MEGKGAEVRWRARKATWADANTYFLVHYAILWFAIVVMARTFRLVLDILDGLYPYAVEQDFTRFEQLTWFRNYAVTIAWICKIPAILPCWRDKHLRLIYQSSLLLDGLMTLNLTLQLLVTQELPTYTANYLSADTGVLSFSTAAMLLWQEAGVSAVLLGSKRLNAVYSGLIVIYVSFGAWSALAADSFVAPVLSLVVSVLTMYATYVSSLPIFL